MLTGINSQQSFSGKFSKETLKMFARTLDKTQMNTAKTFRAGNSKMDNFSVKYVPEPVRDSFGRQVLQTDTYIDVVAANSKKPPLRIKLTDGKLEFGKEMLDLIAKKMVFVDKLKK